MIGDSCVMMTVACSVQWMMGNAVQCKCNSLCGARVKEGQPLMVSGRKTMNRIPDRYMFS